MADRPDSATIFLLVVSVLADALGIAAYLGLKSDHALRLAISGVLAVVAAAAGLTTAVEAAKKWRGPRGPFELTHRHRNRAIASLAALVFAVVLGIATVELAVSPVKAHKPVEKHIPQRPAGT